MPKTKTRKEPEMLELGLVTRSMPVVPNSYDKAKHSMRAVCASENPVRVWDEEQWSVVREVLLPSGMTTDDGQVPLLDCHMRYSIDNQRGSCRDFTPAGATVECAVIFDTTDDGQRAEIKAAEGHLRDLSVGYDQIETYWIPEGQTRDIGGRTWTGPIRVTPQWKIREVSLTPIGADRVAKVRSKGLPADMRRMLVEKGMPEGATDEEAIQYLRTNLRSDASSPSIPRKETPMPPEVTSPTPAPAPDATQIRAEARAAEQLRIREIDAVAMQFVGRITADETYKDMPALRNSAVDKGWSVDQFNGEVLRRMSKQPPITADSDTTNMGNIGMSARELKDYSIVRAVNQLVTRGSLEGIEKEVNDAVMKHCKRGNIQNGFRIPNDIVVEKRALTGTTGSAGGFTVGTEVLGSSLIELLRNKTLVATLGARQLSGLVGNIAVPRQSGGATAYWLSSNGTASASQQAFAQLGLTPHRLVGVTGYDKELLLQSSISVEAFVREDLMKVLAIEKDRAALFGLGAAGQPLGIAATTGVNSVSFSAAATWAKILEFETKVAEANADIGSLAYLSSPGVRAKLKAAPKIASSQYSDFIWQKGSGPGIGEINSYTAVATNQVQNSGTQAHRVFFGNWNDMILADWAGIDVVVDGITLATSGQIQIVITLWTDVGLRHPASFSYSSDSGAQ